MGMRFDTFEVVGGLLVLMHGKYNVNTRVLDAAKIEYTSDECSVRIPKEKLYDASLKLEGLQRFFNHMSDLSENKGEYPWLSEINVGLALELYHEQPSYMYQSRLEKMQAGITFAYITNQDFLAV